MKSLPSDITRWLQPLERSPVIPRRQKLAADAQPCQGRIGILCTPSSIPLLIELKSTIVKHMLRTLLCLEQALGYGWARRGRHEAKLRTNKASGSFHFILKYVVWECLCSFIVFCIYLYLSRN